jgi:hypothetical protein
MTGAIKMNENGWTEIWNPWLGWKMISFRAY